MWWVLWSFCLADGLRAWADLDRAASQRASATRDPTHLGPAVLAVLAQGRGSWDPPAGLPESACSTVAIAVAQLTHADSVVDAPPLARASPA
eukprot:7084596-Pyramimonas_sp.AAC.1